MNLVCGTFLMVAFGGQREAELALKCSFVCRGAIFVRGTVLELYELEDHAANSPHVDSLVVLLLE